ncbi:MAG: adenylate/guanylate cyclase domain-containing protein, partial [Cyclobacteriaceae bacterium]|nr:adenylate/guanylate cyclase domain-containing protein [Cyclobacteriaceae bacterium]
PKEFLKALGHDSIIDVELGDQVQGDMTILFSDIRSFTSITEKLSAEESFEFLNEVLSSITPAITKNGGFIDKYIGDAIMALFPSNPEDAIISALQVQENLSKYNIIRETRGKEKIKIGIGIHTGPLMLGTIGVKDRMDGTVISDAVNLASRLEGLNKLYGTSMIVSENTVKKLNCVDNYHYRFLSYARVKGKENAVRIYEFFDGDEDHDKTMKLKTLPTFNEGINEYYNQKFTRASVKFQDVIDSYPEDHTARLFLERSAQYMVQGVPELWDGVDIVEKVF